MIVDAIVDSPPFSLSFFRQLARDSLGHGGHPPDTYLEIRRWTVAPKIYIQTKWRDSGLQISDAVIQWTANEIQRVLPQLSAGQFSNVVIETGPTARTPVPGWIYLHWAAGSSYGYVGANPGEVQLDAAHTCNSAAVIHEFGHAMGFWHTTERPSVMGGGLLLCQEANLTAAERYHAAIIYARQPGNTDIDNDPGGSTVFSTNSVRRLAVCDRILSTVR